MEAVYKRCTCAHREVGAKEGAPTLEGGVKGGGGLEKMANLTNKLSSGACGKQAPDWCACRWVSSLLLAVERRGEEREEKGGGGRSTLERRKAERAVPACASTA